MLVNNGSDILQFVFLDDDLQAIFLPKQQLFPAVQRRYFYFL